MAYFYISFRFIKKDGLAEPVLLGNNDEIMNEAGIKGRDRKEYVDMIAAQIILQDYLDNNKDKT